MSRPACTILAVLALTSACPKSNDRGADAEAAPAVRIDAERYQVPLLPHEDQALGGAAPLVTIVVFGNYACPPCGRTWLMMRNLVEDYGEDLRVVYRHASIPGYQPGDYAAEAAYAAGEQGKFWEYHWRLVEHGPTDLERPLLLSHAQAVGLDVDKFVADLDGGTASAIMARHHRHAVALGIAAGPVSFVNGLLVLGARDDEKAWHQLIDAEIARSRSLLREGVARPDVYAELIKGAKQGPIREGEKASTLREQHASQQADDATKDPIKSPMADQRYRVEDDQMPVDGPDDAAVSVVAFVDFQCPYCREGAGLLAKLRQKYPQEVRVGVRHLPLEIHPTAKGSAMAAVAADRQGKFWPFYERLFATKDVAGQRLFLSIATDLGLDVDRFKRDFEDPGTREQVERDLAFSRKLGIAGTPAYFVNGRYLYGSQSLATLSSLVDKELAAAKQLEAEGTPRANRRAALMADALGEDQFPNATTATPSPGTK